MPNEPKKLSRIAFGPASPLLDATNLQLLQLLVSDPRSSMAELGRQIGMSAPAVGERMQRLTEAGVVRGYRLDIDAGLLGLAITAFVRIRPMPGALPKIVELAQKTVEVVECHRITGEDCFLMKIHVADMRHLEMVLDAFLAYGTTTTSIVQSSPVSFRAPPFPTMPSA